MIHTKLHIYKKVYQWKTGNVGNFRKKYFSWFYQSLLARDNEKKGCNQLHPF